ncbi:hypothetical protein [Streptomyces sp. NPDC058466]|uniref:hypothetical protein n=1 Tax=Streptomyces sp. NPDC058466 TaxID=3346512 RepID=UPI00364A1AC6
MTTPMTAGRYRLALTLAGRPAMQGWWDSEATARRQFKVWIGERGSMPGARILLVDEEAGETLTTWPSET